MRINWIHNNIILLTICSVISSCSLDESVLSQCEREHPNDLIARLVCNHRVTDERISAELYPEAKKCVDTLGGEVKSSVKDIHAFMNAHANDSGDDFLKNLQKSFNFRGSLQNSNYDEKKVVIFTFRRSCPLGAYILFNADIDSEGHIESLRGWKVIREYTDEYIPELTWRRSEHLEDILRERNNHRTSNQHEKSIEGSHSYWLIVAISIMALFVGIIWYVFTKKLKRKPSSSGQKTPPKSSKSSSARKRTLSEREKEEMIKNKEAHQFVLIDVPPQLFASFLEECNWLKNKTGNYPDFESQEIILRDLKGK